MAKKVEGSIGLRERIRSGTPVLGIWNTLASPLVTEVLAVSGLDFQVIDLEHGPFVMDEVHLHVSACSGYGDCAPLVRVPANEPWMALQALDQGAKGIVVPHIDGVSGAARFAESIRYHPDGGRGFTPFSKAGNFGTRRVSTHVSASNNEVVGVAIVESLESLAVAGEIAGVDGIDVVYFGAYDLSQQLGYPGEPLHPEVVDAISEGVARVHRANCCAGGFVPRDRAGVQWLLELGMGFITFDVDSSILGTAVADVVEWFRLDVD